MVKIKINKKMNFPELVKWAWDNHVTNKTFECDAESFVRFDEYGDIVKAFEIERNAFFEVEVEEELTKDTVIPLLLEVSDIFDEGNLVANTSKDTRISDMCHSHCIAFHMLNPDGTTTLLWTKEGGMVE